MKYLFKPLIVPDLCLWLLWLMFPVSVIAALTAFHVLPDGLYILDLVIAFGFGLTATNVIRWHTTHLELNDEGIVISNGLFKTSETLAWDKIDRIVIETRYRLILPSRIVYFYQCDDEVISYRLSVLPEAEMDRAIFYLYSKKVDKLREEIY